MDATVKLHSYSFANARTYLFALAFVAGNMILPQLCHAVPQGGAMLLPIYFFTLVGAYKYGIRVGLLTAVLSPVLNHLIFAMPGAAMLAPILIKSTLLAIGAAVAARHYGKVSLTGILFAVLAYQLMGTLAEWAIFGDFARALNDLRLAAPGMLIQLFGGYGALRAFGKI